MKKMAQILRVIKERKKDFYYSGKTIKVKRIPQSVSADMTPLIRRLLYVTEFLREVVVHSSRSSLPS